jgi:hypothetical protein
VKVKKQKNQRRRRNREIQQRKCFISAHPCSSSIAAETGQRHTARQAIRAIHEVIQIGHPHNK